MFLFIHKSRTIKISSKYILNANQEYDRRTSLYWSENSSLPPEENYRNRFAYTKLSVSALSKETDEEKLKHHTTFFVSDFNEFSENQIHLSTDISRIVEGYPINLEIELNDYLNYNSKDLAFEIGNQVDNLFLLAGAESDGKAFLTCYISKNLVEEKGLDAGKVVRELGKLIQGGGGGQPFFATAGGKNPTGIEEALIKGKEYII